MSPTPVAQLVFSIMRRLRPHFSPHLDIYPEATSQKLKSPLGTVICATAVGQ